jgi:pilus assembly protein Flp/PilA
MKRLVRSIARFLADQGGPTAVEYAMLMLLVFLACLTAITLVGQSTASSFHDSGESIRASFGDGF